MDSLAQLTKRAYEAAQDKQWFIKTALKIYTEDCEQRSFLLQKQEEIKSLDS